jgi:HK97 family phage portal protein
MSILRELLRGQGPRAAGVPAPHDDFWYEDAPSATAAGQWVSVDSAMKLSAVFACVKLLSEDVGKLPLKVYQRDSLGNKREAREHPLWRILHDQPNRTDTAMEAHEFGEMSLVLRGNAYSRIFTDARGFVTELIPLHPDGVIVRQPDRGSRRLTFEVNDGLRRQVLTQEEMFHVRGLSSNGLVGMSVLSQMREAIGVAQAAQMYSAAFFGNGAVPGGVIEHPAELGDDGERRLRESWERMHRGANKAHRVAVLEEGSKYNPIGISPEDSQLIETRTFSAGDIARFFRVPPHKIGLLDKATFSNIEHQGIEYVTDTLGAWLVRWEQAIARDLFSEVDLERGHFVEFVVESLLRGDIATRYAAYQQAITTGWMTRNEVRKKENLNQRPGLDVPLSPLNMAPAGAPENSRATLVLSRAVGKLANKEVVVLGKILERSADADAFLDEARGFYRTFAHNVADILSVGIDQAARYAAGAWSSLSMTEDPEGLLSEWKITKRQSLSDLAGLPWRIGDVKDGQ